MFYPGQSYSYLLPQSQQPEMVTQYHRTSSLVSRLCEKEAMALVCVWDPGPNSELNLKETESSISPPERIIQGAWF